MVSDASALVSAGTPISPPPHPNPCKVNITGGALATVAKVPIVPTTCMVILWTLMTPHQWLKGLLSLVTGLTCRQVTDNPESSGHRWWRFSFRSLPHANPSQTCIKNMTLYRYVNPSCFGGVTGHGVRLISRPADQSSIIIYTHHWTGKSTSNNI